MGDAVLRSVPRDGPDPVFKLAARGAKHFAAALAAAEKRRESRIAALEPVLAELVERCTEYIETLKP